jgi:ribosomal protein S18 acetylase RimI-like enzyme
VHVDALAFPLRSDDREQLIDLLIDAVHAGASIGFLAPLSRDEAREYWLATERAAAMGDRVVLVARDAVGPIVGTAQVAFVSRANGRHRAEVQKVIVHSSQRRRGIARQLMSEVESRARARGVRLLYLDTSEGQGGARDFYEDLGYTYAGGIPGYALDPDGSPAKNAIYYKELAAAP